LRARPATHAALHIAGIGCRCRPHPSEPLAVERSSVRIGDCRFFNKLVFLVSHRGERLARPGASNTAYGGLLFAIHLMRTTRGVGTGTP